jgi:uncharacterized protein (DUF736 family)
MIIGNFSYDRTSDTYSGEIKTLTFHRAGVVLRPAQKSGEKGPDYRVIEQGANGTVEFGAAWKRTSERGQPFLSIVLDDPVLASSLNAALLLRSGDDAATLVWSRAQRKANSPEPATSASRPKRSSSRATPQLVPR